MTSTSGASRKTIPIQTQPDLELGLDHNEVVPTLRELEARAAEQKTQTEEKQRQKTGFLVRLFREIGVVKQPATCKAYTRQAVPCRRQAIRNGLCRLHTPAMVAKKSLWQRFVPFSTAKS